MISRIFQLFEWHLITHKILLMNAKWSQGNYKYGYCWTCWVFLEFRANQWSLIGPILLLTLMHYTLTRAEFPISHMRKPHLSDIAQGHLGTWEKRSLPSAFLTTNLHKYFPPITSLSMRALRAWLPWVQWTHFKYLFYQTLPERPWGCLLVSKNLNIIIYIIEVIMPVLYNCYKI